MNKKTFIKNFKGVSGALAIITEKDDKEYELIALQEDMGSYIDSIDLSENDDIIPIVTVNKNRIDKRIYYQLMQVIKAILEPYDEEE